MKPRKSAKIIGEALICLGSIFVTYQLLRYPTAPFPRWRELFPAHFVPDTMHLGLAMVYVGTPLWLVGLIGRKQT
jgi:hypothetical protein